MLSRSTEREQEIKAERFIFGLYARGFSPPRIKRLADAITDLDALAACRVAVDLDHTVGAFATEKFLSRLAQSAGESARTKRGQK